MSAFNPTSRWQDIAATLKAVTHTLRIINRPPKSPQPIRRIPRKRRPRIHHIPRRRRLGRGIRLPTHIQRGAEDQRQVAAVIGAAAGIQAEVRPVAKVAVAPDGDAVGGAGGGFAARGTGEAGEVERVPLRGGEVLLRGEGGELVEAGFVVVVAHEVGLDAEGEMPCQPGGTFRL